MSRLSDPEPNSIAQGKKEDEAGGFTRRTVLAGAAAATAAMSVGAVDSAANAQTRQDMILFVLLSGALTGIAEAKLAPGFRAVPSLTDIDIDKSEPGSDPVNVKHEYFNWVNKRRQATLRRLLQITRDSLKSSDRAQAIIDKVQHRLDVVFGRLVRPDGPYAWPKPIPWESVKCSSAIGGAATEPSHRFHRQLGLQRSRQWPLNLASNAMSRSSVPALPAR